MVSYMTSLWCHWKTCHTTLPLWLSWHWVVSPPGLALMQLKCKSNTIAGEYLVDIHREIGILKQKELFIKYKEVTTAKSKPPFLVILFDQPPCDMHMRIPVMCLVCTQSYDRLSFIPGFLQAERIKLSQLNKGDKLRKNQIATISNELSQNNSAVIVHGSANLQ